MVAPAEDQQSRRVLPEVAEEAIGRLVRHRLAGGGQMPGAQVLTDHRRGGRDDDGPDERVSPSPLDLRHELEVHAVDADEEGDGDEDRGDDGQDLHDFVHPIADARKVNFEHPGKHVAIGLDRVDDLDGVVVDVAQKDPGGLPDQVRLSSLQAADDIPQRPDRLAQIDHLPL